LQERRLRLDKINDEKTGSAIAGLGSGGRCAMSASVYHFEPALKSNVKLCGNFHNSLFFSDWMRGWVFPAELELSSDN